MGNKWSRPKSRPKSASCSRNEKMDEAVSKAEESERIKASRDNYEVEVTFNGELGLHASFIICDKNPRHLNFIRVKDFNINHLPSHYRDDLLVDYVQATSDLTCRLSVSRISKDRPKTWPGSDQPFPFYSYKGHNSTMTGTGWVNNVIKYTREENKNCRCDECLSPGTHTPKKTWGEVTIQTAAHVVYDSEEARHTKCQFFYDSHETDINKVPTLTGGEVWYSDVTEDWCRMTYYTHDVELVDRLDKMCRRWKYLRDEVMNKYIEGTGSKSGVDHDLCIIVSHPHGCCKVVTVGALRERHVVNKHGIFNSQDIKYSYNTPTCPGSGGAAVITLYEDITDPPVHSQGRPGNDNNSGVVRKRQQQEQQQQQESRYLSADTETRPKSEPTFARSGTDEVTDELGAFKISGNEGKQLETPESVLKTASYVRDETKDDPEATETQASQVLAVKRKTRESVPKTASSVRDEMMEDPKAKKAHTSQVRPSSSAGYSDRDRAERIRASRGKYEVEVSCTGELGLPECKEICNKNPGHDLNVFPVKDFNLDRLPSDYRDKLLVDYVQATSDITCRLSVSHISRNRPETWPDSDQPFPLSAYKGEYCMITGTGLVSDVYKYTEDDEINCQCEKCSGPDAKTPQKTWGVVRITTACFVVYDDEEARNTECQFYDSHEKDIKTARSLTGFKVVRSDVKGNCTEIMHITHDVKLLDEFGEKCRSLRDLRIKVFHKYCYQLNKKHDLCIIVSHPHGCSKTVSVGKLTQRQLVREDDSGYNKIKYQYDTPTCPGSGGAAVITLVKEIQLQDRLFQLPAHCQNHVPTMVSGTGECDLLKITPCQKNPDHKNFFSVKIFKIEHLPEDYRKNLILKYVRATSNLTCCLTVPVISEDSLENSPPGFCGTGWVGNVAQYTDEEDGCHCQDCCTQQVKRRKRPWGVVQLWTACHNAKDNEEASNTQCHLFYDSPDEDLPEKPTLTRFKVAGSNEEGDWAVIRSYTHDMELLDKLREMYNQWWTERSKVLNIYNGNFHNISPGVGSDTEVKPHDLCIIVSHPHARGKTVTVGKLIKRQIKSKGTAGNEEVTYSYNTPTCPGSSGAPVLTLVENITSSDPLIHSEGGPGNNNSCAVRSELVLKSRPRT